MQGFLLLPSFIVWVKILTASSFKNVQGGFSFWSVIRVGHKKAKPHFF